MLHPQTYNVFSLHEQKEPISFQESDFVSNIRMMSIIRPTDKVSVQELCTTTRLVCTHTQSTTHTHRHDQVCSLFCPSNSGWHRDYIWPWRHHHRDRDGRRGLVERLWPWWTLWDVPCKLCWASLVFIHDHIQKYPDISIRICCLN